MVLNKSTMRTAIRFATLAALMGALAAPLSAATITWDETHGTWDTTTGNWTGGSPNANLYVEGDSAVFNNNAGGTIDVQAGGITPADTTVSAASGSYTFQSGSILGGALHKSGGGLLILTHANDFSSVTVNGGGMFYATAVGALGAGPLTINGGQPWAGVTVTANQTVASLSGSSNGRLAVDSGRKVIFGTDNSDSVYQGIIYGQGHAVKVGSGTFTVGSGPIANGGVGGNFVVAEGTVQLGRDFDLWSYALTFNPADAPGSTGATVDLNGFDLTTGGGGTTVLNASDTASTWVINTGGGTLHTQRLAINNVGGTTGTPSLTVNGNVDLHGDGMFDPRNQSTIIVDGVISGTGGWGNTGNSGGAVRLDGSSDNTISGTLTVSAGAFQLNKSDGAIAVPGDVYIHAGRLELLQPNQIADTSTVTLGQYGNLALNDHDETIAALDMTTGGSKTIASNSTLTLAGDTSDVLQVTSQQNGNRTFDLNLALTGASGGNVVLTNTGVGNNTIRLGGATAAARTLDLGAATRTFTVSENTALGVEAFITSTISGAGGLTKDGAGVLQLSAANTFSGDTLVAGGTLKLNHNLALQNSAFDASGAGALDLTATNTPTFGGLKGNGNLDLPANVTGLTLNVADGATANYSGTLSNANASLIKSGGGTQVLSGANTYTGPTTVDDGTLRLTGSIASTETTTVNPGAILEGAGSLAGDLIINAGGQLLPYDANNPLTVAGDTHLLSDSRFIAALGGGLTETGGLQLEDGWVLQLGNVIIDEDADPIVLFDFINDNGIDLDPIFDWNVISGDPQLASLAIINSGSGSQLVLNNVQLVPEPSSLLSFAGAAVALLSLVRRRRQSTNVTIAN